VRKTQRRQRFTSEREISRPNHQKETPASIVLHLNSKYPVRTTKKRHQASIIVHARTNVPARTIKKRHRRQSCTRKNEIARPNRQIRTLASMVLPLNAKTRVTVLKNHEGGHAVFRTRPNIGLQATPLARPHTWRVFHACCVPPAVAFKKAASVALEAQRWAATTTRNVHAEQWTDKAIYDRVPSTQDCRLALKIL